MKETQLYSWTEEGIYYQIKRLSDEVAEGEVIYLEGNVKCTNNGLSKAIKSLLCVQDYSQVGDLVKITSRGEESEIRARLLDVMEGDAKWLRQKYNVNNYSYGKQPIIEQNI